MSRCFVDVDEFLLADRLVVYQVGFLWALNYVTFAFLDLHLLNYHSSACYHHFFKTPSHTLLELNLYHLRFLFHFIGQTSAVKIFWKNLKDWKWSVFVLFIFTLKLLFDMTVEFIFELFNFFLTLRRPVDAS